MPIRTAITKVSGQGEQIVVDVCQWNPVTGVIVHQTVDEMASLMDDMLKFADGSFDIPNQYQADIYELIYGNGTMASVVAQLNYNKQRLRGLYALFSLVCVKPRFVLDDEDRQSGEIGPRHVGWIDVMAAYNFFRFGPTRSLSFTANNEPEMVAPTVIVEETNK